MLHYETIEQSTLDLLKRIQSISELSGLRLVGGTALALILGHRKSIDLDFFGRIEESSEELAYYMSQLGETEILKASKNINTFLVDNVKVDFVNYHFEWIQQPLQTDGLILAKQKDIAAMKLSAITGRGTKKDFIDLYYLLKQYSLSEIFEFYSEKYPAGSHFLTLRSLLYFEDAEKTVMPKMLDKSLTWETIKEKIIRETKKLV